MTLSEGTVGVWRVGSRPRPAPSGWLIPGKPHTQTPTSTVAVTRVTHVEPGVDSRLRPRQPACAVRRVVWTLGKSVAFRDVACFSPHIDFEAYYSDLQEAVPPRGRQPADCESVTVTSSWGSIHPPVSSLKPLRSGIAPLLPHSTSSESSPRRRAHLARIF